jgi:hypothetical protein
MGAPILLQFENRREAYAQVSSEARQVLKSDKIASVWSLSAVQCLLYTDRESLRCSTKRRKELTAPPSTSGPSEEAAIVHTLSAGCGCCNSFCFSSAATQSILFATCSSGYCRLAWLCERKLRNSCLHVNMERLLLGFDASYTNTIPW